MSRPHHATVVAYLSLFLVLTGGTAVALEGTDTVFSDDIVDNNVKSQDIDDVAVGSSEIASNAVKSPDIDDFAVGSSEIATNAVNSSKIATDAVGNSEIAGGSVNSFSVQNNTLTGTDIDEKTLAGMTCPIVTRYHEGACIEESAKAKGGLTTTATWNLANEACLQAGRRLPTVAELQTFRLQPGIDLGEELTSNEWTSSWYNDKDGATRLNLAISVLQSGRLLEQERGGSLPFRCVAAPQ